VQDNVTDVAKSKSVGEATGKLRALARRMQQARALLLLRLREGLPRRHVPRPARSALTPRAAAAAARSPWAPLRATLAACSFRFTF
jgi:hypothetical protein